MLTKAYVVKRLRMDNGDVVDVDEVIYAPLVLLDCRECAGYTDFDHHSATVVECIVCGTEQSNERLQDVNELRP